MVPTNERCEVKSEEAMPRLGTCPRIRSAFLTFRAASGEGEHLIRNGGPPDRVS